MRPYCLFFAKIFFCILADGIVCAVDGFFDIACVLDEDDRACQAADQSQHQTTVLDAHIKGKDNARIVGKNDAVIDDKHQCRARGNQKQKQQRAGRQHKTAKRRKSLAALEFALQLVKEHMVIGQYVSLQSVSSGVVHGYLLTKTQQRKKL